MHGTVLYPIYVPVLLRRTARDVSCFFRGEVVFSRVLSRPTECANCVVRSSRAVTQSCRYSQL